MSCRFAAIALAAALSFAAARAHAADYTLGSLRIENPWTRATPKGAAVAGGYFKIVNTGTAPDRLIGGSVAFAGRFEVHEMKLERGVMQMRPLPEGLEIKPGETVELKPGGFHVMFMDLREPPRAGQTIKGTLVFEKAGTIEIEYAVGPVGGPPPARDGAMHGGHKPM